MKNLRDNPSANREAKDSVFCDLFSQPRWLLELYRALHPEDDGVDARDIEAVTIDRVVTEGEYNDVGFTVGDRLVVLVEAQATWSANIVTRALLYLAETYRRRLAERGESLHRTAVLRLPAPELYVVYTGNRRVPEELTFVGDVLNGAASALDVRVRVLRAGAPGIAGEYVEFARTFDEVRSDVAIGLPDKAREVVRRCRERGILDEYMQQRQKEVEGIMFTLFDQERETELYHQRIADKARTEGMEQNLARNVSQLMKSLDMSADQAMDALALNTDERARVSEMIAL